jgi:hypothetical protein
MTNHRVCDAWRIYASNSKSVSNLQAISFHSISHPRAPQLKIYMPKRIIHDHSPGESGLRKLRPNPKVHSHGNIDPDATSASDLIFT